MDDSAADDRKHNHVLTAFNIPDTVMDPDGIPAEVWQEIFSLVPRSTDVLSVMLASKRFYTLAFRALHRTVVWRSPVDVNRSLPLWDEYPGMHLAAERLELSVPAPLSSSAARSADYRADGSPYDDNDRRRRSNQLTSAAYTDMVSRMLSFKQLASVTFTDLQLGYRHFELIYSHPLLRTLRIERCGVQFGRFLNVFDPLTLPIKHFTMRNLRRLYHDLLGDGSMGDNAYALLSLARAPNLHTLVIDPSAELFKYIFGPGEAPAAPQFGMWVVGQLGFSASHPPPQNLQSLYIERKHQLGRPHHQPAAPPPPPQAMLGLANLPPGVNIWQLGHIQGHLQAHAHAHAHGDGFPEAALFSFLQRCPTITTYATYHCATQHAQLPPGVLPGLREYAGPVGTLLGVVGSGRPLKALRLTSCTGPEAPRKRDRDSADRSGGVLPNSVSGQREGLPALAAVAASLQDLEKLDVEFAAWDDEIIHAIVRFFPELRSLKVTYEIGGPTETALVAMGPELLGRLAHLRTLHIYARPIMATAVRGVDYDSDDEVEQELRHPLCLFDDTFDTFEDELRELVIPWNRYCPALREVQLTPEYRLLRGYEGGKWVLQRIGKGEDA
ncbi:hypothetical protein DAEQUDRAFT_767836 [Daedalea quercina L-15889]|uniref:Uncharacterized protein n=1 Tax=Daedalea quercina L-15889 TaxID=1314783 RepID=A0A165N7A0_9APHY|nr:hypothetical protein DAEQUDRAFT_767836 [Daedalea quercina L-15889]